MEDILREIPSSNPSSLEELIASATDLSSGGIVSRQACGGGCICRAETVKLTDGQSLFVKYHANGGSMFREEAVGLEALRATNTLRVPRVLAVGQVHDGRRVEDCLILEQLNSSVQPPDFFEAFGTRLAAMHRVVSDQAGWDSDNFLGATPQRNIRSSSWIHFFREERLEYQLQLATQNNLADSKLTHSVSKLCERLDRLLDTTDTLGLLHGDLWNGNYLCDDFGQPAIFDPAVYFGHREAELAMPVLFGGFPDRFFRSYNEAWPMQDGWQDRVEIYKLYHLLNHLNLFGRSYLSQCIEVASRFI